MLRVILIMLVTLLHLNIFGQNPDWGTLLQLDNAQWVVAGKMHIDNLYEGYGTISITSVLKGNSTLKSVKVQFSNRYVSNQLHKHMEAPKYWYDEGQEGIWILHNKQTKEYYNLRQAHLYYNLKWKSWISERLIILQNRGWTPNTNGLSGSVIVDDAGGNKLYRFFYLCLRNDSDTTILINKHYRIHDKPHNHFEAKIVTPDNQQIDMIEGKNGYCRLAGEPGWAEPMSSDLVELKPGEKTYLLSSGDLRCFFKNPVQGDYYFQAVYHNTYQMTGFKNIWTGRLVFPIVKFTY